MSAVVESRADDHGGRARGATDAGAGPRVLVLSLLYPHAGQPRAGLFVRERMARVARELPLMVVSPAPWFPFQGLLRRWRPHFRPPAPRRERQDGIEVMMPRFFSVPGLFKQWDGLLLALACAWPLWRLRRRFRFDVIDAHFAYPDGYAATLLGRWFGVPVTITLRGTESRLAAEAGGHRRRISIALRRAAHVFTVSGSLRELALSLGAEPERVTVVPNGVDTDRFAPLPLAEARRLLGLPPAAPVLVSVGTLVERKGFHRVIDLLPALRREHPDLAFLVVGGSGPEGDWSERLRRQVRDLGLGDCVHFLGHVPPERLHVPLSAADVFVLATRNEGWANVFLEAMACGLPVVTTDRGGNREVVTDETLGTVVPFDDPHALRDALGDALGRKWDRDLIRRHARANGWDSRIDVLVRTFRAIAGAQARPQ